LALIKNPALGLIAPIYDLPASQLSGVVNLDDGDVSLTLDIADLTRRGLAGIRDGWYQAVLENVHSAADDESSTIVPYTPAATASAPYPTAVGLDYDVYLLRAQGLRVAGAGTLDEGWLRLLLPDESIGIGIEDDGTAITAASNYTLARFTDVVAAPGGLSNDMLVDAAGDPSIYIGTRLPRGCSLNWATTSVTASATFRCLLTLGLFPVALGQDVAT